jgi:hypothetical protein
MADTFYLQGFEEILVEVRVSVRASLANVHVCKRMWQPNLL